MKHTSEPPQHSDVPTMTRHRKRIAILVTPVVVVALAILAGCDRNSSGTSQPSGQSNRAASTPSVVHIGSFSRAIDYAPYLIAKQKGDFERVLKPLNMTASYDEFQTLPSINEALGAGRVDVMFEAEPPAIIGKASGVDLKITGLSTTLSQEVLVHKDGPSDVSGLRGKKIAVLAGTSSHYGLFKILEKAGLNKGDVEIVDMAPPDAKTAFEAGQVAAWAVWPPFVEQEELSGNGKTLGGGTAVIHSLMVTRGAFANGHRDAVQSMVNVIYETKKWMLEHPTDAQKIVAEQLKVPQDVVAKAWPRHDWKAQLSDSVIADIQAKSDFLKSNSLIKVPVTVKDGLVDLSFQQAVK